MNLGYSTYGECIQPKNRYYFYPFVRNKNRNYSINWPIINVGIPFLARPELPGSHVPNRRRRLFQTSEL